MISASTHADLCKESKTADFTEAPVMGNSSEIGTGAVSSKVSTATNSTAVPTKTTASKGPAETNTSGVPTATNASEMPRTADSINVTNATTFPDVPNLSASRKSSHPDSVQSIERISAESDENERIQYLVAQRQWKELCSKFLFPLFVFTFVVLGLQFVTPVSMTSIGQVWHRYSIFLCFLISLTGLVTEIAYEELNYR